MLVVLPLIIIFLYSSIILHNYYKERQALQETSKNIQTIQQLSQLFTSLQKERGLSSGYLANKG